MGMMDKYWKAEKEMKRSSVPTSMFSKPTKICLFWKLIDPLSPSTPLIHTCKMYEKHQDGPLIPISYLS
jgi:hypothetical protein